MGELKLDNGSAVDHTWSHTSLPWIVYKPLSTIPCFFPTQQRLETWKLYLWNLLSIDFLVATESHTRETKKVKQKLCYCSSNSGRQKSMGFRSQRSYKGLRHFPANHYVGACCKQSEHLQLFPHSS